MTPRQLFAWCEIMDRAQMARDAQTASMLRIVKGDHRKFNAWMKKQLDQSEW